MKILKHDDNIRLAAWDIEVASVGTVDGCSLKWGRSVEEGRALHKKNGGPQVFATFAGHVIAADPTFHARDKALVAAAIVVEDGEIVEVDGRQYRLKVMPRNHDYPRNSDPIHFVPVEG